MSIWEAVMLICFGFSWPMAIWKTFKAKNPAGKSVVFAWLIIIGYAAGIIHKCCHSKDLVLWLYVLNLLMVATDLTLVYYYRYKNSRANKVESNN
jgi:hypothetical protein